VIIAKTKKELIKVVAQEAGITQATAEIAVNTVRDAMVGTVMGLGRFSLAGFGVFTLKKRRARQGHNPQDGSPVHIPEKNAVKFKMAEELRREVNS
jgi:DNA-binding protein HU-beta